MLLITKKGKSLKAPGILKGIVFIVFPRVDKILPVMLHIDTRFKVTVIAILARIIT
jgi:hypothetical protein